MVLPSCVESLLNQNPTLIHLRDAKSFVPRAACKVTLPKMGLPRAAAFRLERAIPRLFSLSILMASETKNGRAKSTLERVATLFLVAT